jgi:lysine 2,3-aminomutase
MNFSNHRWQSINSISSITKLVEFLSSKNVPQNLLGEVSEAIKNISMSIKLTPYILSRINYGNFVNDPVRKQFIPMKFEQIDDHPMLKYDSLNEAGFSPVKGLVHRYPKKALFLALSTCPVYCKFCTRSYAIGQDTENLSKDRIGISKKRYYEMFDYIQKKEELNDIVISGGDVSVLEAELIHKIGKTLLDMPNIKRLRFATKILSVAPMKVCFFVNQFYFFF